MDYIIAPRVTGKRLPITSDEVKAQEFDTHRWFREGYDVDQVDAFLDRIAVSVELLNQANRQLFEENARLRKEAE